MPSGVVVSWTPEHVRVAHADETTVVAVGSCASLVPPLAAPFAPTWRRPASEKKMRFFRNAVVKLSLWFYYTAPIADGFDELRRVLNMND